MTAEYHFKTLNTISQLGVKVAIDLKKNINLVFVMVGIVIVGEYVNKHNHMKTECVCLLWRFKTLKNDVCKLCRKQSQTI